jgi:hypothetical protein
MEGDIEKQNYFWPYHGKLNTDLKKKHDFWIFLHMKLYTFPKLSYRGAIT